MIPIVDQVGMGLTPTIFAQTEGVGEAISKSLPFADDLVKSGTNLGIAVVFLVIGWIVALFAKKIVRGVLKSTDIDNRIVSWIGGDSQGKSLQIEDWIANLAFWLIFLFAIVAFLQKLELDGVSGPLATLLGKVTSFLPQVIAAVILIGVAWLLATLVKLVVTRVLDSMGLDERLGQQVREEGSSSDGQFSINQTIGNALYWFIFLLFLPSILSTLQLEGTLAPVQGLLNEILAILPNIFAGILIGAAGWLIAQIVRRVVTNFLTAAGVDRVGGKVGLSSASGKQSLSWILGTIVYILILIPAAIAALNALQISAISEPAIAMLQQVLNILPNIFAAGVVLILFYIAGQYVSEIVTNILTSFGFNNLFDWLGFSQAKAPTTTDDTTPLDLALELELEVDESAAAETKPSRTPSELAGIIVLVAIVLVGTLTAVDILQIEALRIVVGTILAIAGQVLVGVAIFAVGLFLSNQASNLIASSGTRQSQLVAQAARIAIIVLVSAMALQQVGLAPNIINLAFGLLVGGIAVAIALAFGLGGRDIAAQQIQEWLESFKKD